jgi:NADH dehydrogenase FAD-containing subunit
MPPLLIFRQRELVAANMKLRRQRNAAVLLDEVTGVDTAARRIETRFGASRKYDFLVLAYRIAIRLFRSG